MKSSFYITMMALLLFIFGCTNSSTTSTTNDSLADKETNAPVALTFINKVFKNELTPGCDSCPKVTAAIPVAEGDSAVVQKINDDIFAVVQSVFGEYNKQFNSYDSLLANFMNMYKKMKADLPNSASIGWEGNVKGSVIKQTDSFVNIKLEAFTFTGGAHPNTNTYSLLFNAVTGYKIMPADIIKDVAGLTMEAEKKFRKQLKIPANAPVNSTIYTFDNNKFVLPKNIFFTDNGLVLHYNAYEIAPYYVGATIVTLPYADVQQYLAIHFNNTVK